LMVGHFLPPDRDPAGAFQWYRKALAPGSYLAVSHLASDLAPVNSAGIVETLRRHQIEVFPRTRAEVSALVLGDDFEWVAPEQFPLEPATPELVTTSRWRPDHGDSYPANPDEDGLYAGVARKPS
ncbi:SAM-dependent methyltransferase, partial [Kibdelosporangium lantanae]